jgi:pimeloyl-ACP methyl ester carboxylesterase
MKVEVNGVRLFFDVEGAKFVVDGKAMREKPTLLLLHGGPGFDHSTFKPAFSQYADITQIVYLDHRGNGRSDRGPQNEWTLAQWGDDIFDFCRALDIEQPIVMGQSFGGMVAMAYATRHPDHPGKLILSSTAASMRRHVERSIALFGAKGGPGIAAMARRALTQGYDSQEFAMQWLAHAMPAASARAVMNTTVLLRFLGPGGEGFTFDLHADLARIRCPTLVLGGAEDPMTPIESQRDIAAAIPQQWVHFVPVANAGHGAFRDEPSAFDTIRRFILGIS